ncbi:MAG: hypothetical protein ACKV2T_37810 [Kofleriaceae bacterium]
MGNIVGRGVLCVMLVGGIVSADTTRPLIKGKTVTITVNKSATLGGLSISFGNAHHKHAADGDTLGMWTFVAKKGRSKKEIELRSEDANFEAEVAIHGVALVFRHVEYEKFNVTLFAQKAPRPLDDETCADRVSVLAAKQGLKEGPSRGYSNRSGIVTVTSGGWTGYCGTLTKRVWIETASAVDDTK